MSELQTFVGYLGGVQKFFEQRRKRVTQSRKDAGAPSGGSAVYHCTQGAGNASRSKGNMERFHPTVMGELHE